MSSVKIWESAHATRCEQRELWLREFRIARKAGQPLTEAAATADSKAPGVDNQLVA